MLYEQSEDYRPLFWFGGRPVHATTFLVALHSIAFVVVAILVAALGVIPVFDALRLDTSLVWVGQVWRLFSYVFVDPAFFTEHYPNFLLYMIALFFCGREVEKFIGRSAFLWIYLALILVPALMVSLLGLWQPFGYLECFDLIFGFFIAFATLYPGVCLWFSIPLTNFWLAWIFLTLFSLVALAQHDLNGLLMLWLSSGTAYLGIRFCGGGRGMEWLTDWLEERRMAKLTRQRNFKVVRQKRDAESIDAILDKISQHGMNSLSEQERAALEEARAHLIKRDGR